MDDGCARISSKAKTGGLLATEFAVEPTAFILVRVLQTAMDCMPIVCIEGVADEPTEAYKEGFQVLLENPVGEHSESPHAFR